MFKCYESLFKLNFKLPVVISLLGMEQIYNPSVAPKLKARLDLMGGRGSCHVINCLSDLKINSAFRQHDFALWQVRSVSDGTPGGIMGWVTDQNRSPLHAPHILHHSVGLLKDTNNMQDILNMSDLKAHKVSKWDLNALDLLRRLKLHKVTGTFRLWQAVCLPNFQF